jgi:hypothetical protein
VSEEWDKVQEAATLDNPEALETEAERARREKAWAEASAKAEVKWKELALAKDWDQVKADLEVYRYSGESVLEDPRRKTEYKDRVVAGLKIQENPHLNDEEKAAATEVLRRKAAAFWLEGAPRTTVLFVQHDTIPTGPPCRTPPYNLKGEEAQWSMTRSKQK